MIKTPVTTAPGLPPPGAAIPSDPRARVGAVPPPAVAQPPPSMAMPQPTGRKSKFFKLCVCFVCLFICLLVSVALVGSSSSSSSREEK